MDYLKKVEEAIAAKQKEIDQKEEELRNLKNQLHDFKNQREKIIEQTRNKKPDPCTCKICRLGAPY